MILIPLLAGFIGGPAGGLTLFLMIAFPIFSADLYFRKVVKKQPFVKRYKAWINRGEGQEWNPSSLNDSSVRNEHVPMFSYRLDSYTSKWDGWATRY